MFLNQVALRATTPNLQLKSYVNNLWRLCSAAPQLRTEPNIFCRVTHAQHTKSSNALFRTYLLSNNLRLVVMSAERPNKSKQATEPNSFSNQKALRKTPKTRGASSTTTALPIMQEINKLNKFIFNKNFICCKESRIESANSFYSSFYLGPFEESFSQTLAHNLRRTLLSELPGLAITAVEIDGVLHRFSSVPGTKETTMDILSNLQNIVLKKTNTSSGGSFSSSNTDSSMNSRPISQKSTYGEFSTNTFSRILTNQIAYLRTRGPGVVKAADIILPSGIECVNPDQHLATLAEDGILNMKLIINEGKNAIKQKLGYGPQINSKYNWGLGSSPLIESPDDLTGAIIPNNLSEINTINNPNFDSFDDSSTLNSSDFSNFENMSYSSSGQDDDNTATQNISKQNSLNSNIIFLDSVFMPVTKVNAFVETNAKATDISLENSLEFINPSSKTIQDILDNFYKQTESDNFSEYEVDGQSNFSAKNSHSIAESQEKSKMFFKVMADQPSKGGEGSAFGHDPNVVGADNFLILQSNNINQTPQDTFGIKLDYKPEGQILVHQPKNQCHIVLEIWTNGSIHPRQALKATLDLLTSTLLTLNNVKQLGSMYKSDLTYKKILKNFK